MKKIKYFLTAFLLLFVGVLGLASCSSGKPVVESDVIISTEKKNSNSIELRVNFNTQNSSLNSGTCKVHIKSYLQAEGNETYKDDLSVSYNSGVNTVTFSSLTASSTYLFKVYVQNGGSDYLLKEFTEKTSSKTPSEADAIIIKSVAEFNTMKNDAASYYKLDADLDFEGATLSQRFSSTTIFTGTFDGQNHTIKNFSVPESVEYTGLFEYTDGAVIKNVKLEGVKYGKSNSPISRGNTKLGGLVGYANRTLISNVEVNGSEFYLKPTTSAELFAGGLVGYGKDVTIENVKMNNVKIDVSQAHLKVNVGLLAGLVEGNGLKDKIAIDSCFVQGEISAYLYYTTSSEGYFSIGGMIGNVGSRGTLLNSYSDCNFTITKYNPSTTSTSENSYYLYLGGFVGSNNAGTMKAEGCVAASSIKVYAGAAPTEEGGEVDYSANQLTRGYVTSSGKRYYAFFGGFIGKCFNADSIKNCAAVFKNAETPIYVNAKKTMEVEVTSTTPSSSSEGALPDTSTTTSAEPVTTTSTDEPTTTSGEGDVTSTSTTTTQTETKTIVLIHNICGNYEGTEKFFNNVFSSVDAAHDYTIFTEAIQAKINEILNA